VSYTPRPGSKTEALVNAILAKNDTAIRSTELATLTGIPAASVQGCLQIAVDAGIVTACKVEVPGKRDGWEYRRGSGIPPPSARPELANGLKRIVNGLEGRRKPAVGPIPPRPAPPTPILPACAKERTRDGTPRIAIDQDGSLELSLDDLLLHLTPAQTLALGDFLVCTQPLWRP
jgi:hypothetical protein